jgi:RNA polymerase sigma-70 factor (sigma-E family)
VSVDRGAAAGHGSFEAFVAARLSALHRYAFVLTGDAHDAEDLVQEALARTGAGWSRVRNRDQPEAYVRTVMVRVMCNRWRRPRRERLTAEPPETGRLDPALSRVDDDAAVEALLRGLPPRQRAVLVLRYVEGLSEAEIADTLGCAPGTVKSQAAKALASLRRRTVQEREAVDG